MRSNRLARVLGESPIRESLYIQVPGSDRNLSEDFFQDGPRRDFAFLYQRNFVTNLRALHLLFRATVTAAPAQRRQYPPDKQLTGKPGGGSTPPQTTAYW